MEEYYKAIIGILRFIGFNDKEIEEGIRMLPDNGTFEPKELIAQVAFNAVQWSKAQRKESK